MLGRIGPRINAHTLARFVREDGYTRARARGRICTEIINNAFDGAAESCSISNVACYAQESKAITAQFRFFNGDQIGRTCDIIMLLSRDMRHRRSLLAVAAYTDLLLIIRLITP